LQCGVKTFLGTKSLQHRRCGAYRNKYVHLVGGWCVTRSDNYHDPLTLSTTSKITKLEISIRFSLRSDTRQTQVGLAWLIFTSIPNASLPYIATERSNITELEILDGSSAFSRRRQVALQMLCAGRCLLGDLHYYLLLCST